MASASRAPRRRRRRVFLMYGNGGGGHKATASAIHAILHRLYPEPADLSVERVDAAALSGAAAGDWLYNQLLARNAVSAIDLMHSALQLFWPLALPGLRSAFRSFWAAHPDLSCVVSLIPMLNAVFAETLPPAVPLFTVLTDFSHTSSHPWIQHPRQHLVAGTDVAFAQALAHGYLAPTVSGPSHVVTRTDGMVVHPRFYHHASATARAARRAEIGLHPTLPTVLLLFGAAPPTALVAELVSRFTTRRTYSPVNLIAVCGRNTQLLAKLTRRKQRNPAQHLFITGFSDEIPLLMQMSDILIGKPGPGVVSEAFVSRLPCVLLTGADENHVMKQEREVLDWVRLERIGLVVRNPEEAAKVTPAQMFELKERVVEKSENRAVFQVGELILKSVGIEPQNVSQGNDPDAKEVQEELGLQESEGSGITRHSSGGVRAEADIGDMDLPSTPQSSAISTRKRISIPSPKEKREEVSSFGGCSPADPQRMDRPNSLSPTTITALRPRGREGRDQETLPSSRATQDLG